MTKGIKLILTAAVAAVSTLGAGTAFAQQTITIYISGRHILSTDTYTFEIYDRVCNRSAGTVTVSGGEQNKRAVSVCAGGTGKGSITYRNVTLNGPTVGSAFLEPGESVHP